MKSNPVVAILLSTSILLTACEEQKSYHSTGYVSDNILYLTCPYGGYIERILMEPGQAVAKNQTMVKLNDDIEQNDISALKAKLKAAKDNLSIAEDGGSHASKYAIDALKQEVTAATANLDTANWVSSTKNIRAPIEGFVHDIYYKPGEYAQPMQPIASVLVPENMQIIFYIPEENLDKVAVNQSIKIMVNHTAYSTAIISINNKAEFTPDSMFNEKQKHKNVFKVTAKMTQQLQAVLKSGQLVEIDYDRR